MRKPYIVCSTARSGTNFFRHILHSHNLGHPYEWDFKRKPIETEADLYQPTLKTGYIAPIWSRTMWHEILLVFVEKCREIKGLPAELSDRAVLEATFPEIQFIYLYRGDTVRQAISYLKAKQSDVWCMTKTDGPDFDEYIYDPLRIESYIRMLRKENALWEQWFKAQGITPLSVRYEECVSQPLRVLESCAEFLGLKIEFSQHLLDQAFHEPGALIKQADDITEEWVARYNADSGENLCENITKNAKFNETDRQCSLSTSEQ